MFEQSHSLKISLLPSSSNYLSSLNALLNELEVTSKSLEESIELSSPELKDEAPRYSRDSIAPSNKSNETGEVIYQFSIFSAASLGAIVFWFSAADAVQRYSFGSYVFFKWNAPVSALLTNMFFNEMAYLDYLSDDYPLSGLQRIMAIVVAVATIAPYFFVGFYGALWQKIIVGISVIFDFPVFYYGALDFYHYFHADFVQQWRWFLRCSKENFILASQKASLVSQLKSQYNDFVYGSKEKRAAFITKFSQCNDKTQLSFLVNQHLMQEMTPNKNACWAWMRWLLFSGSGLIGISVIIQNLGHVPVTILGVLLIKQIPFWAQVFLIILLAPSNLLSNLGYSFATMADFDFLEFLSITCFFKVSQAQRVIAGDSLMMSLLLACVLILLRYIYITSGFSNDEVNYEGALYMGATKTEALCVGINGNLSIALIYNGVLCEKLFRKIMIWMAEKTGDNQDKQQLAFEKLYSKLVTKVMLLPLAEVRKLEKTPEFSLTYANYFSSPKTVNNVSYLPNIGL